MCVCVCVREREGERGRERERERERKFSLVRLSALINWTIDRIDYNRGEGRIT